MKTVLWIVLKNNVNTLRINTIVIDTINLNVYKAPHSPEIIENVIKLFFKYAFLNKYVFE
ncbi:hypothetical protein V1478_012122 [Vespula squamosa]|uniref:Uncharacterized protein n=1 Tax=Vespula squamosa TaxID=30214 RepID=A0ABD2ACD7_VESSQ